MAFYAETETNVRRLVRLAVALVPLMMLLVGSCKTGDMPASYGGNASVEQFRTALFPDRVNRGDGEYKPAPGYISRARKVVSGRPEWLSNLTEQEVSYMFGEPAMKRKDADARIWQYKKDGCIVDVYFYDGSANGNPVSYVDYRGEQAGNKSRCLKALAGI